MPRVWAAASIRLRLTAWYVAAMCLMLVVYAAATFVAVRHEFYEQLEAEVHDDFEAAERLLVATPAGGLAWTGEHRDEPDEDGARAVDVWASSGELLYRSDASPSLPPVSSLSSSGGMRYESLAAAGRRWETLTGASTIGGRAVVLRVARSEDRLRAQLSEILVVLVLGLPLVVALAGLGGYVLARRALMPIDHLGTEARRMTADRLHERLSVPNPTDEIGRLAAVINDTYARLQASFDQLRRFTADASHELRTPLAVLRGMGEIALKEPRTTGEYQEAIGGMLEGVDRLTNLVDTLLRLSYGDAGTVRLSPETIDLGDLAREVTASLAILAEERNQRLEVDASEPVLATVDRPVLREAVTNIVDNAIKYGPQGSRVHIRVYASRDRAVVEVADKGPGVAPEHRLRIFDRFFRVDEARSRASGGAGLGLAIAKWAVEVNGGVIAEDGAPAGGACFRISLPRATTSVRTARPEHQLMGGQI